MSTELMMDVKINTFEIGYREVLGDGAFCDDVYLVNGVDGFSVVGSRHSLHRLEVGDSFLSILDIEGRNLLKKLLSECNDKPFAISTLKGTAIIDPCISQSSLFFIVHFLNRKHTGNMGAADSLEKLKSCMGIAGDLEGLKRADYDRAFATDLKSVMKNINTLSSNLMFITKCGVNTSVAKLNNLIKSATEIAGASASVEYLDDIILDDRFDYEAFVAFIVSLLMLCRARGATREAKINLSMCFEGVVAEVSFETLDKLSLLRSSEVRTFYNYAEVHNMIFEQSMKDGRLRVAFCPSRKDWSYLGVKRKLDFDWDN